MDLNDSGLCLPVQQLSRVKWTCRYWLSASESEAQSLGLVPRRAAPRSITKEVIVLLGRGGWLGAEKYTSLMAESVLGGRGEAGRKKFSCVVEYFGGWWRQGCGRGWVGCGGGGGGGAT